MGQIRIEGLGLVDIEGDSPNEIETSAILKAVQDLPKLKPPGTTPQPEPPLFTASDLGDVRTDLAGAGPLGIVPERFRTSVRQTVSDFPGLVEFFAEAGPSVAGAFKGARVGGTFGGVPGAIGGAIIGGVGTELIAQEIGIAPVSETNLNLSAAGPLVGPGAGQVARFSGRLGGKALSFLPPIRVARAKEAAQRGAEKLESLGTTILSKAGEAVKGTGVGKVVVKTANQLFTAARNSGVTISPVSLKNTRIAIDKLKEELEPIKALDEVKQALKVIEQQEKTLFGGTLEIGFKEILASRRAIGLAIKKAERGGGTKLGAAKLVFKGLADDLDDLVKAAPTKEAAKIAQAAVKRAKLEFAVRDIEQLIAKHTTDVLDGSGITINAKALLKNIRDLANPKSKSYDKNFADALKDDLPAIKENLKELAEITSASSPAGPGSIVVRGLTSKTGRAIVGALVGESAGGGILTGAGALIGAQGPEMMVAIFTSKLGTRFIRLAAEAGKGEISLRAWIIAGQIVLRSAGASDDEIQAFAANAQDFSPPPEPPIATNTGPPPETEEETPAEPSVVSQEEKPQKKEEPSVLEKALPEIQKLLGGEVGP